MAIDPPEQSAILDARPLEPAFERRDRTPFRPAKGDADPAANALLTGLRSAQGDDQPLADPLDVSAAACSQPTGGTRPRS
jgi:hypothetical protein